MVALGGGGAFSHERGTPVRGDSWLLSHQKSGLLYIQGPRVGAPPCERGKPVGGGVFSECRGQYWGLSRLDSDIHFWRVEATQHSTGVPRP